MIEKIYEQLNVPKTPEEIQLRFTEIGLNWNINQIELLLDMDKNIECNDGKWSIKGEDTKSIVLSFLDDKLKNKPIIPIQLVIDEISITIGKPELIKIVNESNKFKVHQNGRVICKK